MCRMGEGTLSLLESYGSQLIRSVKFRDTFVMIGQKGLARGKAIEMVSTKAYLHKIKSILKL